MSFITFSQIFACKQFLIFKKDFNRFMKNHCQSLSLSILNRNQTNLTGYGDNNFNSLGNYYLKHRYLSEEEKEKIIDEWAEF